MEEELSERARRILGEHEDDSLQGDLAFALDLIEARAVPRVAWSGDAATVGLLVLSVSPARNGYQWTIARGNGMDDDIDYGLSRDNATAKADCETALLRLVGINAVAQKGVNS